MATISPGSLILLQPADALFPTGAYAHSLGSRKSCASASCAMSHPRDFLRRQIVPAQREHEIPYSVSLSLPPAAGHLAELRRLDLPRRWKLAPETRDASAQLALAA